MINAHTPQEINERHLTVYLPEASKADGRAVIICPGGAYHSLALDNEGHNWAPFFTDRGIACAVLAYTLPNGNPELPMADARHALELLKEQQLGWRVDPAKVGIMGLSAGGHLAAMTAVTLAGTELAPAFQILMYPVISMMPPLWHEYTAHMLLGDVITGKTACQYSAQLHVSAKTAPAFIAASADDPHVNPDNAVIYWQALHEMHVDAALHVYPRGGHAWGMDPSFPCHEAMLADLDNWLRLMP